MHAQIVTSFIFFCYTFFVCFYLSLAIKAYLCNADRDYLMLYCLTLLSEMNMALNSFGIYINSNLTSQETKEQYQFYPTAISNWLFFGLLFLSIAVICFTNNYYPCF